MTGTRVLVIDDNAANRRLLQVLLHSRGYEVYEASNAPEGFAMLTEKPPDVILMDLRLPGMDGLTATRKLKTDPATRSIPVVAVTSYAMKGDEERAREAGCCAYVTKPIDKTLFFETVARVLRKTEGETG
jgi:CheY-like chemotaxis protein